MDKLSTNPEMNQENEVLNEVNSIENEVIETITEGVNEVIEPVAEITEDLNGKEVIEPIAEVTNEVIEPVEEITESIKEEIVVEEIAEVVEEVIEPVAEITEIVEEKVIEPITEEIKEVVEPVAEVAIETPVIETIEKKEEVVAEVEEKVEITEELKPINVEAIEIPELHVDIPEIENIDQELAKADVDINYEELNKEQLVVLLEDAIKTEEINSIKANVSLTKVAFLKIVKEEKQVLLEKYIAGGGKKEEFTYEEDELELRFRAAFDVYKERKTLYNDEQEKIKLDNLKQKQAIIDELKELINSDETLKQTYDDFKSLQERWKEIGQVPRTEINTLWQNYHFLIEKFFDKVKINKELKDLDMRKNMESKLELCEKVEELLLESNISISFKKLQQYHEEWKSIGPVPQDKRDELWERFKNISDQINDRRHEYYNQLHEEHEGNLLAKNALCEKAEQIVSKEHKSLNEYQTSTDELNEVIKIWKTIGPINGRQNEEIWVRFKTYLDTFFANKKEYYDKLKEEQVNNYNLKVELCLQAEAIKSRTDWKIATNEIIELQKQWKEVGPVPRKNSDKIWLRFRAACDEFFNTKSEFFKSINENEANNLKLKEELIQKVKDHPFGEDRNENLQALKDFQRQYTEIGYIPVQYKDKIYNEFRLTINACFDKLKINSAEVSTINMNNRIEKMNPADASRFIGKERVYLSQKITKLKEDISLWENNIGFLAQSKKADLLKQEFEKKIHNAKQELIVMETKLKSMPH